MTYRLASWNIGSDPARTSSSNETFESHPNRVAAQLASLALDFLCLQEQHFIGDCSEGVIVAGLLGLDYHVELPLDVSHHQNAPGAEIGISVLSKHALSEQARHLLPNPGLVSIQPSGDTWTTHDKGLLLVDADLGGREVEKLTIACLHLLPLDRFDVSQDSSIAAALWSDLDEYLCRRVGGHVIIAGDFNSNTAAIRLPLLAGKGEFVDLRFPRPTQGRAYDDHIMVSRSLRVVSHSILQTTEEFDHGPCVVEFAL